MANLYNKYRESIYIKDLPYLVIFYRGVYLHKRSSLLSDLLQGVYYLLNTT